MAVDEGSLCKNCKALVWQRLSRNRENHSMSVDNPVKHGCIAFSGLTTSNLNLPTDTEGARAGLGPLQLGVLVRCTRKLI